MSKIEVNKIGPQCGTTLTVGCGAGQTVAVDANTVTIGRCGGTVALASGATQSGFGRTGTVDWQTGDIKTSTFTAVNGQGFFANTTSGGFTANLPAGAAGAIVSFADYAGTWQTGNLTVSPNGSDKIGSVNSDVVLNTEGQSVTFVFVDSTQGWINVQDSTSNERANPFIQATGGTETCSGNDRIHTFTGPGTFTVSAAASCAANNIVSYLVLAGGGGGGGAQGGGHGGGGAGGYREVKSPVTPYTASPLDGYPSSPNRITVTAQAYPITVGGSGAGGAASPSAANAGTQGGTSTFSTISSAGGGGGGVEPSGATTGGSGGGAAFNGTGANGNTPSTTPPQGQNGGNGVSSAPTYGGGGGGGAGGVGGNAPPSGAGNGGNGTTSSINATPTTRAGGGGAGLRDSGPVGSAGPGGGGSGGTNGTNATNGTDNTGGGGGGSSNTASPSNAGGNGGSGIVIIRYKRQ